MLSPTILHAFTAFVAAHPGAVVCGSTATGLAVYRSRTPEQWIALGESNPAAQGLFKMAAGAVSSPRGCSKARRRSPPWPHPRPHRARHLRSRPAHRGLEASLAATSSAAARPSTSPRRPPRRRGGARPVDRGRPGPIAPFDPTLTQDLTEGLARRPACHRRRPPTTPERGATSLSAAIATVALLGIAGAVGAMVWGCDPTRRFVLDLTDGVPSPRVVRAAHAACNVTDAGVHLPVQCSDDHRRWPAMPLRPTARSAPAPRAGL